jgi:hypothetical protein
MTRVSQRQTPEPPGGPYHRDPQPSGSHALRHQLIALVAGGGRTVLRVTTSPSVAKASS